MIKFPRFLHFWTDIMSDFGDFSFTFTFNHWINQSYWQQQLWESHKDLLTWQSGLWWIKGSWRKKGALRHRQEDMHLHFAIHSVNYVPTRVHSLLEIFLSLSGQGHNIPGWSFHKPGWGKFALLLLKKVLLCWMCFAEKIKEK